MNNSSYVYNLATGEITPEPDLDKWLEFMEKYKIINQTQCGLILVSTVFRGLLHVGGMFETMVLDHAHRSKYDEEQWRYDTLTEAQQNHIKVVELIEQEELYNTFESDIERIKCSYRKGVITPEERYLQMQSRIKKFAEELLEHLYLVK